LADESSALAVDASPGVVASARTYLQLESLTPAVLALDFSMSRAPILRLYDRRRTRPEDSPTFRVRY
jgi:hypothetical protein